MKFGTNRDFLLSKMLFCYQIFFCKEIESDSGAHLSPYIPFMADAASQAGDADSSRAPGLTSGLHGSVNVHRGALLLVPQCNNFMLLQ